MSTLIGLAIVKPLVLLIFVFIFSGATWLVKRFATTRMRDLLLRKLW